jgi:hypothetical protein
MLAPTNRVSQAQSLFFQPRVLTREIRLSLSAEMDRFKFHEQMQEKPSFFDASDEWRRDVCSHRLKERHRRHSLD